MTLPFWSVLLACMHLCLIILNMSNSWLRSIPPLRQCMHEGCPVTPSFNAPNERKRLYCGKHKQEGMVRSSSCLPLSHLHSLQWIYCQELTARQTWALLQALPIDIHIKDRKWSKLCSQICEGNVTWKPICLAFLLLWALSDLPLTRLPVLCYQKHTEWGICPIDDCIASSFSSFTHELQICQRLMSADDCRWTWRSTEKDAAILSAQRLPLGTTMKVLERESSVCCIDCQVWTGNSRDSRKHILAGF